MPGDQVRKRGEVAGQISEGQPQCFTFGAGAGQTACVQVLRNENVCFNVGGVDCRDDLSFQTEAGRYRIDVFQLMRGYEVEQYMLRLTIR